MAEITVGDLLTWEPRLSLYLDDFLDGSEHQEPDEDREVTWVVTVRASLPVLPPLRAGDPWYFLTVVVSAVNSERSSSFERMGSL